jgi:hypothetical protein
MPNLAKGWAIVAATLALGGCDALEMLHAFPEPTIDVRGTLPVELPYREGKGGVVILTGRVDDKVTLDFILDTGAPVSLLIDGASTAALGFDTSHARTLGPKDDPASPIGIVQPGLSFRFDRIALSGVSAVVMPERLLACPDRYRSLGFAGVIGADLLRRFVVEVDPAAKRVRLHDPAHWVPPKDAPVAELRFDHGHAFVDTKVTLPSGETLALPMHLDTGMTTALALVAGSNPGLAMPATGEIVTSCFVGRMREDRLGAPVSVDIGGARFADVTPRYSPAGERPRVQEGGAVGSGLLSTRHYAIDFPGRRVVFL